MGSPCGDPIRKPPYHQGGTSSALPIMSNHNVIEYINLKEDDYLLLFVLDIADSVSRFVRTLSIHSGKGEIISASSLVRTVQSRLRGNTSTEHLHNNHALNTRLSANMFNVVRYSTSAVVSCCTISL